jgi:hypothetical protein
MPNYCRPYKRYIVITYLDKDNKKIVKKYCAIKRGFKIVAKHEIQIRFNMDMADGTAKLPLGFRMKYEFKDATFMCAGLRNLDVSLLRTGTKFTMKSQNYPKPYNPSTQCRWRVVSDSLVHIYIKRFLGEKIYKSRNYNLQCNEQNDNIQIYYAKDCSTDRLLDKSTKKWGIFCGRVTNQHHIIKRYEGQDENEKLELCIVFVGDNDRIVGPGFEMYVDGTAPVPKKKPPQKKPAKGPKPPKKQKKPKKPKAPKNKKPVKKGKKRNGKN